MNTSDNVPSFLVLVVLGLYFLPTIRVYWLQRSAGHPADWRRRMVLLAFLTNALMGWSIIGWFWALKFARVGPQDMVAGRASPVPASGPGPWGVPATAGAEPRVCSACNGRGSQVCMPCAGQGGRWRNPQTANGVAQWEPCTYCTSSGSVACTSCGGTGKCW